MSSRGCTLLLLQSLVVAAPAAAEASYLDLYGFNPRAMGMAGASTAVADDFTALFYNPAGLTAKPQGSYGFGLLISRPSLSIDFAGESQIPGLEPPNATAVTFGGMFQLGGDAVRGRIAMGFAVAVPTRSLLNGQALDPAIPHWYMYQSLPERLVALLGIGVLPVDWLSLGAGVQFLASLNGQLDYELDFVAGRFSRKTVTFDIEPSASLTLGAELRPIAGLRLAVGYRQDVGTVVDLPVNLELTGLADFDVQTVFTVQYTPHEVSFGASYFIESIELLVTAEATYAMWSSAPDPSVDSNLSIGGDLFDGTGLGGELDAPAPGQARRAPLGFSDIFIPRVAVEKPIGDVTLRAGYALRPSPAPAQSSGSNYVDGTAHTLGAGASLDWKDPWDILANPITLDVAIQVALLPSRRHDKADASDPVGSFDASGSIIAFGTALRYSFEEATLGEADGAGKNDEVPDVETRTAPEEAAPPEGDAAPPDEAAPPEGDAAPPEGDAAPDEDGEPDRGAAP